MKKTRYRLTAVQIRRNYPNQSCAWPLTCCDLCPFPGASYPADLPRCVWVWGSWGLGERWLDRRSLALLSGETHDHVGFQGGEEGSEGGEGREVGEERVEEAEPGENQLQKPTRKLSCNTKASFMQLL